jgi:hypothetical protein
MRKDKRMTADDAEQIEWFRFTGIAGLKRFMRGRSVARAMRQGLGWVKWYEPVAPKQFALFPIDTAPQDGTSILIYADSVYGGWHVVWWGPVGGYDDNQEPDGELCWMTAGDGKHDPCRYRGTPIAWAPLPDFKETALLLRVFGIPQTE